jgi:hypothetical protein
MKNEYNTDLKDIDEMISILASLHDEGFETKDGVEWRGFDLENDEDDEDDYNFTDEDEEGDVPPPPPGFEGYPGMEYSLN